MDGEKNYGIVIFDIMNNFLKPKDKEKNDYFLKYPENLSVYLIKKNFNNKGFQFHEEMLLRTFQNKKIKTKIRKQEYRFLLLYLCKKLYHLL